MNLIRKEDFEHVMGLCASIESLDSMADKDLFFQAIVGAEPRPGPITTWGCLQLWSSGRASFVGTALFYTSRDRERMIRDLREMGLINW